MDRSTKERLIGAIVLVAVAWLVIPVFLDGPEGPQESVRQTVDLPGQQGQTKRTKTIVLNPPAEGRESPAKITDPAPATRRLPAPEPQAAPPERTKQAAAETTRPEASQAASVPAGPQPRAEPESGSRPESGPAAAGGGAASGAQEPSSGAESSAAPTGQALWAVQLGSFSSQENAERLAGDLRKQGFAAFLSRVQDGGRQLHRVRVGPQGSRDEAEKVAARLAAAGHDGQVVSHP